LIIINKIKKKGKSDLREREKQERRKGGRRRGRREKRER
jgi:hypothetical protein